MAEPKALARAKKDRPTDPDMFIWRFGDDPNGPACISTEPPASESECKPLQSLIAHLDLMEWVKV